MQTQDGHERVIAYASRPLKDHEKNYGAFLLEMAAACFGIEHFDTYLLGRKFVLCVDHKPMEKLGLVQQKTLNRLQQLMLEHDFTLKYRKGEQHVVPDCLSRNVVGAISSTGADVRLLQGRCEEIQAVRAMITGTSLPRKFSPAKMNEMQKMAKNCVVHNDLLFYKEQRAGRQVLLLVAPPDMRRVILQAAHAPAHAGHGGMARTLNRVKLDYWWRGVASDVSSWIGRCQVCQQTKAKKPPPAPLQALPVPAGPNERVHIDLFGPLRTSEAGNKYIMVMTDAFTKYAELACLLDKTAQTVARAFLDRWICRFSAPVMVVTDQGKEFCNKILARVCELWDVGKKRTSPFHPQTNSSAESYNRTIVKYMRAVIRDNLTLDWEALIPMLMLAYNCHVHRSTGGDTVFPDVLARP